MFINSIYNIKTITVKETLKKNQQYQNCALIDAHMKKQCLKKPIWKSAIGANPKVKRLKLQADNDGLFSFSCSFL